MTPYDQLLANTEPARNALFTTPILGAVAAGDFTLDTYHRFLANAYHHVRFTVPLMMATGSRLSRDQRWLMPLLREYIEEELGHEQWILDDLKSAGGDPCKVEHQGPSLATDTLVRYVRDYTEHTAAVGFFGMVLVLEGTSTSLATPTAKLIQCKLGLPEEAFTYLTTHGELDLSHLDFFGRLINRLTPEDLAHVTHVASRVYPLYAAVLDDARTGAETYSC